MNHTSLEGILIKPENKSPMQDGLLMLQDGNLSTHEDSLMQIFNHNFIQNNDQLIQNNSQNVEKSIGVSKKRTGPVRRSKKGGWTDEEDQILKKSVLENNSKNWKKISLALSNKSATQCLHRWQKVLNPNFFKGNWETEEDEKIIKLVKIHGPNNWSKIAQELETGRIGKQCRERWYNHLNPEINKKSLVTRRRGIYHKNAITNWKQME